MTTAEHGRSVLSDERGAILLCGLLFCVLCVSAVYYLWSIAEVIRYRERVQDAADMAAFSGAVVHAHGMNLIALLNMVMAALLAILVALRLVQLLCWFAIGAIVAIGWLTGGALYSAVPPLQTTAKTMDRAADRLKDPIHSLIKVLHKAGDGVARATPLASAGRAIGLSRSDYGPDVKLASPIPLELKLPVESDAFDVLCEHAGKYAGEMAMFPLDPILPDKISGRVSGALGRLTKAGSGWFCGKKGASPPSLTRDSKRKQSLPASAQRDACIDPEREVPLDGSTDEVCLEATIFELSSQPDRKGLCRQGRAVCPAKCPDSDASCPPTGASCNGDIHDAATRHAARRPVEDCAPLQWRLQAAHEACKPPSAGGPKGLRGLWWKEQRVNRTYRHDGVAYRLVEEQAEGDPEVRKQKKDAGGHPCGDHGLVGEGYGRREAICESPPVCLTPRSLEGCRQPKRPVKGATYTEQVVVVQEIVHCIQESKVPEEERSKQAEAVDVRPEGDDDALSPFKLKEGVWLGDDALQLRALALGRGASQMPVRGVELAAWGQPVQPLAAKFTRVVERVAAAQGEYFFHDADSRLRMGSEPDFLWKMGWRARLRPLRLSGGALCGTSKGKWQAGLKRACKKVDGALREKPPQVNP